jgi:NADH-quinone oxidoreductase subunit J
VHALLYLVVSLLAVGVIFYALGAPFAAALEVIIYAGAVMVLFAFVVMMLSLGSRAAALERRWMPPAVWLGPGLLALILAGELAYLLFASQAPSAAAAAASVGPARVGKDLFGPYLLAVELASILLLAALAGAYHLGRESGEP